MRTELTDAQRLQAAIDRAREEKRPSLDAVIHALKSAMDAARSSADSQQIEGMIVLSEDSYRGLYYASLDAKNWLERGEGIGVPA